MQGIKLSSHAPFAPQDRADAAGVGGTIGFAEHTQFVRGSENPTLRISYGIVQPDDAQDEGVPFVQTTNMTSALFVPDDEPAGGKLGDDSGRLVVSAA